MDLNQIKVISINPKQFRKMCNEKEVSRWMCVWEWKSHR